MLESKHLSIVSRGKKIILNSSTVLYVLMDEKIAEIHVSSGKTYETRMTLGELEEKLGGGFIKIHRGCIVSVMAIHDITDKINLSNGESLSYTVRKKKQIMEQFLSQQEAMIRNFGGSNTPVTAAEYHRHYSGFDNLPVAFTDIEMVFNGEKHAVDWIFRYANPALAKLEKQPLEKLVGSSFGSLFTNMDSKWLRAYERATLYHEVLEVIDHHRINDFSSQYPVQFRNEIVGSTCTIVATIFRENQIPIPVDLAGLMLGAILSDTLNFHSPTTTEKDRTTANILAAIADLDVEDFATEMFTATASKVDSSPSELIKTDMKIFEVYGCKLSISQVILASLGDLHLEAADIQTALDRFAEKKDLDLAVLAFTSIQENGSVLYFGGNRTAWGKEAFPDSPEGERPFHEGLLSRKQQLLPQLTKVIEKYA